MKASFAFVSALALLTMPSTAQSSNVELTRPPGASRAPVVQQRHRAPELRTVQETPGRPRPMIGVRIAPVDNAVSAQLPEQAMPALILTSIFEDSPAERAGLQVNDVITAVDGNPDVTVATLIEAVSSKSPGTVVKLDVSRAGTPRIFNVTVEEFAAPVQEHQFPDFSRDGHWQVAPGTHPWPRFGVGPGGKIMVQRDENGNWIDTDASTDYLHKTYTEALGAHAKAREEAGYLDLTKPHVDPQGHLRRTIEHLHDVYRAHTDGLHEESLEQRIGRLETKVDEIHHMLSELLHRAK